jgi:hypothetical protein
MVSRSLAWQNQQEDAPLHLRLFLNPNLIEILFAIIKHIWDMKQRLQWNTTPKHTSAIAFGQPSLSDGKSTN